MAGEIWIPIGISSCAVIIAFIAFWRAKPATSTTNSMFECFKILSDPDVKYSKEKLTEEWCSKKGQTKITFSNNLTYHARKVRDAYESVCAIYNLELINKQVFREVYGSIIVSTYHLMKDEIDYLRHMTKNSSLCKNFENVAVELISDYGVVVQPYCPPTNPKSVRDPMDMSTGVTLVSKRSED